MTHHNYESQETEIVTEDLNRKYDKALDEALVNELLKNPETRKSLMISALSMDNNDLNVKIDILSGKVNNLVSEISDIKIDNDIQRRKVGDLESSTETNKNRLSKVEKELKNIPIGKEFILVIENIKLARGKFLYENGYFADTGLTQIQAHHHLHHLFKIKYKGRYKSYKIITYRDFEEVCEFFENIEPSENLM